MSDSKPEVTIKPKVKKVTPAGENIDISQPHAALISEFVSSPAYKILKQYVLPQHQDRIAREALATSEDYGKYQYYRGRADEVKKLCNMLEAIKNTYKDQNTDKIDKQFKK